MFDRPEQYVSAPSVRVFYELSFGVRSLEDFPATQAGVRQAGRRGRAAAGDLAAKNRRREGGACCYHELQPDGGGVVGGTRGECFFLAQFSPLSFRRYYISCTSRNVETWCVSYGQRVRCIWLATCRALVLARDNMLERIRTEYFCT